MQSDPGESAAEAQTLPESESQLSRLADGVPLLTILAHPDPERIGQVVALPTSGKVEVSRLTPDFAPPAGGRAVPLGDLRLSRSPITLEPRPGGGFRISPAASGSSLGVDGHPLAAPREVDGETMRQGVILLLARRVTLLLHHQPLVPRTTHDHGLVGESAALTEVRRQIDRVAGLPYAVLITGETGTGKELVARAIHRASERREAHFHSVNMAAVPPSLAAAELFGSEPGAYTGARGRQPGFFGRAAGGTLFLDEIGEAPNEVQALLLRALENREIQPVGATRPRASDVRILTATDQDLSAAVTHGSFRSSLLYRLSQYEIRLPALRQRREDIGRLLLHFLRRELRALDDEQRLTDPGPRGKSFIPAELVGQLARYHWPGNVRQLKNLTRQLLADARGGAGLPAAAELDEGTAPRPAPPPGQFERRGRDPASVTEDEMRSALTRHGYNLRRTAADLGLSRSTLYELMQRAGIRTAAKLTESEIRHALERHGQRIDRAADELRVSGRALKMRMGVLGIAARREGT